MSEHEQTGQEPRIIDHPYQPTAWPDTCGYQYPTGWPCGYSQAEHERLEGAPEGGEAIEQP